jgi:hypothetical protein
MTFRIVYVIKNYKFIWNDKREKVKRGKMNKNYVEGGLKMIDIHKYT